MARRRCVECVYYLRRSGYCILLGKRVDNPEDPPCRPRAAREEHREPVESIAKTTNWESLGPVRGPIRKYLLPGEKILAVLATTDAVFYATDRRVLRYEKQLFLERAHSLHYRHILSTSFERKSYTWLLLPGALLLLIGWSLKDTPSLHPISAAAFAFGIILIYVALAYKPSFWQIRAVGMSRSDYRLWRIPPASSRHVKEFIDTIEALASEAQGGIAQPPAVKRA